MTVARVSMSSSECPESSVPASNLRPAFVEPLGGLRRGLPRGAARRSSLRGCSAQQSVLAETDSIGLIRYDAVADRGAEIPSAVVRVTERGARCHCQVARTFAVKERAPPTVSVQKSRIDSVDRKQQLEHMANQFGASRRIGNDGALIPKGDSFRELRTFDASRVAARGLTANGGQRATS